ncbi:hypothetical protein [Bradyrhizobium yuanmingense]|uniref:hypothetical protein n=1 Tax=Bradyrhizobium yuanmingense TaxID=108015 RepID=UPI0023B9F4A9|nr:hypothetical protein [Bradyrhizobium yuanmingense]MDF0493155.1 hypothetical protein [Bradyrhizobium yuanmingense]
MFEQAFRALSPHVVMAGLVPAIDDLFRGTKNVDARAFASPKRLRPRRRDKPGHDGLLVIETIACTAVTHLYRFVIDTA